MVTNRIEVYVDSSKVVVSPNGKTKNNLGRLIFLLPHLWPLFRGYFYPFLELLYIVIFSYSISPLAIYFHEPICCWRNLPIVFFS